MDTQTSDRPSYYAIIPANIRYCKTIEPQAKLLYGEITALSNQSGFCWASNKYFAELYDVDERTVQRWLESLKKNNFIHVEIIQEGIQKSRRIWLSNDIKKMFTSRQKCRHVTTKMSPRHDKNVAYNNTSNSTEEYNTYTPVAEAPSMCVEKSSSQEKKELIGSHVCFTESQVKNLIEKYGKDVFYELVEDINDYCTNNRPKGYHNYEAALRTFHKKQKSSSKVIQFSQNSVPLSVKNREIVKEVIKKNPGCERVINTYSTHVEIQNGSPYPYSIDFKEQGFLEQFRNALIKSGHKVKMA